MNNEETWKDIPGYEGLYKASNIGNIKSYYNKNGKSILKPSPKRSGYLQVILVKNKRNWSVGVHILVLMAFTGSRIPGKQVNHIDGNKHNNNLNNLEWVTASENMIHSCSVLKNATKPVLQMSKRGDVVIAEYESLVMASMVTGVHKVNISICCRGITGSAGGYKWQLKDPIQAARYQNRIFKYKYRVYFPS